MRKIQEIEIGKIGEPIFQRLVVDKDKLEELKRDIKKNGLIYQITITKDGKIVDGYLRFLAYKELGIDRIPAQILSIDEKEALITGFRADVHRQELSDYDVARVLRILNEDYKLSYDEIASKIQKSKAWISQHLAIFKDKTIEQAVKEGKITVYQAREIQKLPENIRKEVIKEASKKTVLETAKITAEKKKELKIRAEIEAKEQQIQELEKRISEAKKLPKEIESLKRRMEERLLEIKTIDFKVRQKENKDFQKLIKELSVVETEYYPLLERQKQVDEEIKRLQKEAESIKIDNKALSELTKEQAKILNEIAKVTEQIRELQKKKATLLEQSRKIAEAIKSIQRDEKVKKEKERQIERLQKEKEGITKKIQKYKEKYADVINHYKARKKEAERFTQILEQRKAILEEIAQLKAKIKEYQSIVNNIKQYESKLERLKGEKTKLEKELKALS